LYWFNSQPVPVRAAFRDLPCDKPGWFPEDFGLKDHTIFWYKDYYYIAANYLPGEKKFAYGRSPDLCNWEVLEPILDERIPGSWDEMAVWSPYVFWKMELTSILHRRYARIYPKHLVGNIQ
jgi:hypothetical protein